MRILVVRPAPAAFRTAARLAERGHAAVVAPVLAVRPTGTPPPAGPFDALVLTSANAAEPARDHGGGRLPVFCVGAETAAVARTAGFADVTTAGRDATALAEFVRGRRPPPARLLLAAGRDRKAEPERTLRSMGYETAVWPVYTAEILPALPDAARQALATEALDGALHYSRRSAAAFLALAEAAGLGPAARGLRHLCLSADVAAGLSGCERVAVAASPDEPALLDLVRR